MKFLNKMNQLVLLGILMLSAHAFAQEPAQDLHDSLAEDSLRVDSLHVDSLSKISLTADIDANNVVDTNKVEHIDAGITKEAFPVKDYFPEGFFAEIAYEAPAVLHFSLGGVRWVGNDKPLKKYDFLFGVPILSLDIDENMVSDEGILSVILFFLGWEHEALFKLDYLLFGDTYFSLSDDGRFGLFEKHRILDFAIYSLTTDGKPWEFGFSEAFGLRSVFSKNYKGNGCYMDLGAHVRITNQRFRYGFFVQFGVYGGSG